MVTRSQQIKKIPSRIAKSKIANFENFARRELQRKSIGCNTEKEKTFQSLGMVLERIQKQYYKDARYLEIFQHITNPLRDAQARVLDYFDNFYYKYIHESEKREQIIIKEINSLKFQTGENENLNEYKIVYYRTARYFSDSLKKNTKTEKNRSEDPEGPFRRVKKQIESEISDIETWEDNWFIAFTRVRRTFSLKSSQPWKLAEGRVRDQLKKDLEQRNI